MTSSRSEELDELRALVRRFLAEKSPSAEVRRLSEAGAGGDPEVWGLMAQQVGLQGLVIPEEFGGSGCGPVEIAVVMEEMGRSLAVSPLYSTVLAAAALAWSGDPAAMRTWLPGVAEGAIAITIAVDELAAGWELDQIRTTARRTADGWAITGTKRYVVDGVSADLILVVARAEGELGLFAVNDSGMRRRRVDYLDHTRELAEIRFDDAAAVRIDTNADDLLPRVHDLAMVAIAAEQVGGAARCLEMAVDYAKLREQFGRPIGSFQAIKHKCANLLVGIESSRSAAYHAAEALEAGDAQASVAARVAKNYSADSFVEAAKECIQIHGGIGYTWEHDAHLYLRRAKSSQLLFGTPARQRARLADMVGI